MNRRLRGPVTARRISLLGCALFAAQTACSSADPTATKAILDVPSGSDAAPPKAMAPAKQAPITSAGFAEISGHAADDIWTVGSMGATAR